MPPAALLADPVTPVAADGGGRVRGLITRVRTDSLVRNSVLVMATTGVNAAFGYLFWIAAARSFTPVAVGQATAAISAMNLAGLIATLGVGTALIAHLPGLAGRHDERSRHLTAAVAYTGVAGLLFGIGLVVVLPMIDAQLAPLVRGWAAVVVVAGVVAQVWGVVLDGLFVAERRAEGLLARNAGFAVLKLVLLVAGAAALAVGGRYIVTAWVVASVVTLLGTVVFLVRRLLEPLRVAPGGAVAEVRRMARPALVHHLAVLGGEVPMFLLPVIVVARAGAAEGAFFYTTWMVGSLFFTISAAASASLFAEGGYAPDQLRHQRRRTTRLIAALLAPVMIGMLVAGPLVLGLFGPQYAAAGYPLLVLLVISAVPDAVTNVGVAQWRVQGRTGRVAALNVGMASVTLVGTWLLAPVLGVVAPGWAWLTAQTLGTVVVLVDGVMSRRSDSIPSEVLACAS
ncbi:MAG: lipopolysaccharide biosynthesis protein [Acidimicrobiales bacterium]